MEPAAYARTFWERRLQEDWTETGVGYRALGRPFNSWMYRVRREVFLREASTMGLDPRRTRVLDVGSGTGFYVACWLELGMSSVVGCDLTQAAVARLQDRFPGNAFHRIDISDPESVWGMLEAGSFDAVSCMDVLFHITDDARYRAAVSAIAQLVRPGGQVILSENFLHRPEQRGPRQVNRSIEHITRVLDAAGLEPVRRVPMLVLMNAQVDASAVRRKAWGAVLRGVTLTPVTGWLAGAALYPLERQLVRRRRESPSTELMVCRRRPRGWHRASANRGRRATPGCR